jgi:zinc transport system ATP-binding protein
MSTEPLISAHGLVYEQAGLRLIDQVDIALHRGEVVTVIGPNGAGKTTLIRLLLGLTRPSKGKVQRNRDLTIGYVPQRMHIDPVMPLTVRRFLATAERFEPQAMIRALQEVGGQGLEDRQMSRLSGGELQRVLLARAILRIPDMLVLDEPAQGVDLAGQAELYRLIGELRDRYHCGVLLVSHDLHLVMESADSVMCLNQHVCCSGKPEAISRHPEYLKLFGAADATGLAVYSHEHDHCHDVHGNIQPVEEGEGCKHG